VAVVEGRVRVVKVRSTVGDPGRAVMEGLSLLGGRGAVELRHGTTVGTNAMLERKGARVAFVTTAGFEDTIAIGRQTRPRLYAWTQPGAACLVAEGLRFGVPERVSAEGEVLKRPTEEELAELVERVRASGAEAVAVSLLFAFLNAENEARVVAALESLGLPMSVGHRMLPEFREYERGSTLVVNAYLAPVMSGYLLGLEREVRARYEGGSVEVMQSSGGIVGAGLSAREPVRTVLSGPAGGVIGAWEMARAAGFERVIGFDMGGTSTDVFLADAATGGVMRTQESVVAGVPVSVPMLDIHTAGAGGGSLARFDAGGLLRVGPESAGSEPGPVCFGRGEQPTVTDANLLLGRLEEEQFMGGAVGLDVDRARAVFQARRGELGSVEAFAEGILRVVETQMERAIRVVSVERGHDPRRFTLVAFGGGGPLHACAVARALRVPTVLIPAMPGALSAVGILLADAVRDYSRTVMVSGERMGELEEVFAELETVGAGEFAVKAFELERSVDVRYVGQGYEINVAYGEGATERFHAAHAQRYGFANRERGDVAILNDPYAGGTHLPDITMVMPVFCEGAEEASFFVAARAHHADVGGMFAGSMGPAREIFQEGLRIPPVKLVRGGVVDEGLMAMVLLNVRTPEEREGDLAAQIGACRVGEQRLLGLVERYGVERLRGLGEALLDYSERLVRAELKTLPSGTYAAEDWLDEDGVGEERVRIAVSIAVDAELGEMTVDFAGTAGQVAGSVNAVRAITLSACFYVLRCLLGEEAPATAGIMRPLTLSTEIGSVVDARPPAAVAGGNVETSQRIVDVLLRALALAAPERVPAASAGTMSNLTIGGVDARTGAVFTYYETTAGGMGASAREEGLSGVQTHMTNSLNTPVEALEFAYPVRMRRYGYRRGSGGEGRHRGGDGLVKELEMLCDAEVTLLADRRVVRPYGLEGGGEGAAGKAVLREGEVERVLPGKCSARVKSGAVLRLETPGGGGWSNLGSRK
jgi:N-methylhydantoinase A